MKVLWFSNTPANASEYFEQNTQGGGWLQSLDQNIQDDVDLHVAFYYNKINKSFKFKETTYHPISKPNWKSQIIKEAVFNVVKDEDDLDLYLKIIEEVNPDLIHIHGTENSYGCIVGKTKIPVVISIQGNITVIQHKFYRGIDMKYSGYKRINSLRGLLFSKSFKNHHNKFKKLSRIELKNMKDAKYIIGRTDWDRRITRVMSPDSQYFHVDETLRNHFYSHVWKQNESSKTINIHTTNSNSIFKGFETLCEALTILNKMGFEVNWTVAGISDIDEIVTIVKRVLKDKFPQKGLKLLGRLNEKQLVERLLSSDLYIMPSHIENSPNNLCEAMILGMPIIGTFAGGTSSILKNNEEGILIQDGDPWALAGAILEITKSPDRYIKMGQKARERALTRHNPEKIVNDLLNVYLSITNQN